MGFLKEKQFFVFLHGCGFGRQNDDVLLLFNGIVEGDLCAAFAGGRGFLFVVVDDAKTAVIYHLMVLLNVGSPAGVHYLFGIVGVLVAFQQIGFVIVTDHGEFRPHVDSFYVRVFFFYFGYELKAKAVKAALTAEQKGIDLFIDDQPFDYPAQPCSQFLGFIYLPVPEETAGFLLHILTSRIIY